MRKANGAYGIGGVAAAKEYDFISTRREFGNILRVYVAVSRHDRERGIGFAQHAVYEREHAALLNYRGVGNAHKSVAPFTGKGKRCMRLDIKRNFRRLAGSGIDMVYHRLPGGKKYRVAHETAHLYADEFPRSILH